jgi:hypothetical protein
VSLEREEKRKKKKKRKEKREKRKEECTSLNNVDRFGSIFNNYFHWAKNKQRFFS